MRRIAGTDPITLIVSIRAAQYPPLLSHRNWKSGEITKN